MEKLMDIVKIIGVGFIAVIISIILKQYRPEFAIYIAIIAGIIIIFMLSDKIMQIINEINRISQKANINTKFIGILLKITGIAILSEYAVSLCKDANENAIASKIDFGGKIIIIALSLPIIQALMDTAIKILPWLRF